MATVAAKPMTAKEFYEWVHRPENRDRFFELDQGEIIEMPPPVKYHGFICGNVAGILRNYAIQRKKGYVCSNDTGLIVERDPDTVRGPDVTLYEDVNSGMDVDRQYSATPPVLAVEVLSPSDRVNRTVRRVTQLLNLGVKIVWVIDPETRDVSIYRPGRELVVVNDQQEITGDDALPGLRCRVAEFFSMPGQ